MGRVSVVIVGILLSAIIKVSAQSGPSSFEFVENKGQWDKSVKFLGELSSGAFYIQNKGFTVNLHHPNDLAVYLGGHDELGAYLKQGKKSKK